MRLRPFLAGSIVTFLKDTEPAFCIISLVSTPRKVQSVTLEYESVKPGPFFCMVQLKTDLQETPVVVFVEGVVKP